MKGEPLLEYLLLARSGDRLKSIEKGKKLTTTEAKKVVSRKQENEFKIVSVV